MKYDRTAYTRNRPSPAAGRQVYLDGTFVPAEQATVSVFDHGLLYGDGVFEGIRAYNGLVFRLDEHVARLYDSAKAIGLRIPLTQAEMGEIVCDTVRANGLRDAYIRLVVTRGPGDLGLDPLKCPAPSVICIADAIKLFPEELYDRGLRIITAATRRNVPEALNPRIKSLNYLNNILAKIEANQAGVLEALMLTHDGFVAEGTGDNLFFVKDGVVCTPAISQGILHGITRACIIELARKRGIAVAEMTVARYDLFTADECFLTGTAAEVIPVVEIDSRVVGTGQPGPVTRALIADFRALVVSEGTPVYTAAEAAAGGAAAAGETAAAADRASGGCCAGGGSCAGGCPGGEGSRDE
ncbi:MAG: branched-chain-amino-acid transaminase [Bacillota bacterium]|nr:branched-chain-amino-acid transaminase [Bacillota bacterium]